MLQPRANLDLSPPLALAIPRYKPTKTGLLCCWASTPINTFRERQHIHIETLPDSLRKAAADISKPKPRSLADGTFAVMYASPGHTELVTVADALCELVHKDLETSTQISSPIQTLLRLTSNLVQDVRHATRLRSELASYLSQDNTSWIDRKLKAADEVLQSVAFLLIPIYDDHQKSGSIHFRTWLRFKLDKDKIEDQSKSLTSAQIALSSAMPFLNDAEARKRFVDPGSSLAPQDTTQINTGAEQQTGSRVGYRRPKVRQSSRISQTSSETSSSAAPASSTTLPTSVTISAPTQDSPPALHLRNSSFDPLFDPLILRPGTAISELTDISSLINEKLDTVSIVSSQHDEHEDAVELKLLECPQPVHPPQKSVVDYDLETRSMTGDPTETDAQSTKGAAETAPDFRRLPQLRHKSTSFSSKALDPGTPTERQPQVPSGAQSGPVESTDSRLNHHHEKTSAEISTDILASESPQVRRKFSWEASEGSTTPPRTSVLALATRVDKSHTDLMQSPSRRQTLELSLDHLLIDHEWPEEDDEVDEERQSGTDLPSQSSANSPQKADKQNRRGIPASLRTGTGTPRPRRKPVPDGRNRGTSTSTVASTASVASSTAIDEPDAETAPESRPETPRNIDTQPIAEDGDAETAGTVPIKRPVARQPHNFELPDTIFELDAITGLQIAQSEKIAISGPCSTTALPISTSQARLDLDSSKIVIINDEEIGGSQSDGSRQTSVDDERTKAKIPLKRPKKRASAMGVAGTPRVH